MVNVMHDSDHLALFNHVCKFYLKSDLLDMVAQISDWKYNYIATSKSVLN